MKKEKKNRVKGIFGTVLFHALLLLLLSLPFMSLTYQDPPPKKGGGSIAINFSTQKTTEINTKPIKEEIIKSPEKIVTQDNTEALVVKKTENKEEVVEEEEEEIQKVDPQALYTRKKKNPVAFESRDPDDDLGDSGGGGRGGEGSGIDNQLGNRNPIFLPDPIYESEAEGVVVVHIIVDQFGNVIFVNPGEKGSTTLNTKLVAGAKNAAFKTKFPPKEGAPNQHGKLIYTFQKN